MGAWFDKSQSFGVEASGFFFESNTSTFTPTNSVLAVPIAVPAGSNVASGENAVPIASPATQSSPLDQGNIGPYNGSISVTVSTRLWGLEFNGVANMYRSKALVVDLLGAFVI